MTFHEWFNKLPRPIYCPICKRHVTIWHKHWRKEK